MNIRSVEDTLKVLTSVAQNNDPLASFFGPKATFGAPAEPLLLAGTLVGLTGGVCFGSCLLFFLFLVFSSCLGTVFMLVLSFVFDSCFRGGLLKRVVFGGFAAATVVLSFFILVVIISGAFKVGSVCIHA